MLFVLPIAPVVVWSEEARLGFVPSARQKRCHEKHLEDDGLALMEQSPRGENNLQNKPQGFENIALGQAHVSWICV